MSETPIEKATKNLIVTFCPEAEKNPSFADLTREIIEELSRAAEDSFVTNVIWDGLNAISLPEFSHAEIAELIFWQLVCNHANAIYRWMALCHIAAIVRGCSYDTVCGPFVECELVDKLFMCLSFASNRKGSRSKKPAKDYLRVVIPSLIGIYHGTAQGEVKLSRKIPELNIANQLLKKLIPKAHEFFREYDGEISIDMLKTADEEVAKELWDKLQGLSPEVLEAFKELLPSFETAPAAVEESTDEETLSVK